MLQSLCALSCSCNLFVFVGPHASTALWIMACSCSCRHTGEYRAAALQQMHLWEFLSTAPSLGICQIDSLGALSESLNLNEQYQYFLQSL